MCCYTRTVFHIKDTLSYILLDLQKTLSNNKTILRCQNKKCNKLFYPISNKNKTYCRFKDPVTGLTCDKTIRGIPKDDFSLHGKRARGTQQRLFQNAKNYKSTKYVYDYALLEKCYENWQIECNQKLAEFRRLNDLDGFKEWIKETKFTVKNLERLGIRSLNEKSSPTN